MKFSDDAFISYAHLDDTALVEGRKGWISNLHRALEVRIGQMLGKTPSIWRDPKLSGNDFFAETLIERLGGVASLVAVVTPRYLNSAWTMRELNEFWAAAEARGGIRVDGKARVFKVLKTPVPAERTSPRLRSLLGYEFFRINPDTGKVREFDEIFGPDAQRDFWIKLDDLAYDICALLREAERHGASTDAGAADGSAAATRTQTAVFLAVTTSDLQDQREALKRELQQHGYVVLPDHALPLAGDEAREVIQQDLASARLTIQMIGRLYGIVPEGSAQSFVELQHELIGERARLGPVDRVVWIPSGLTTADPRQREFLERIRSDERIDDTADLLETFFEDLRAVVHEWVKRDKARDVSASAPVPVADPPTLPTLYLIADQRDVERIEPWADALFDRRLEIIHPVFEGDEAEVREYHQENLKTCDGVLIFYGSGDEAWVRRKLRELQKNAGYGRTKPPPAVGICLIAPRTPTKERFRTHQAMVVPQWTGCELHRLEPFVDTLKADHAV